MQIHTIFRALILVTGIGVFVETASNGTRATFFKQSTQPSSKTAQFKNNAEHLENVNTNPLENQMKIEEQHEIFKDVPDVKQFAEAQQKQTQRAPSHGESFETKAKGTLNILPSKERREVRRTKRNSVLTKSFLSKNTSKPSKSRRLRRLRSKNSNLINDRIITTINSKLNDLMTRGKKSYPVFPFYPNVPYYFTATTAPPQDEQTTTQNTWSLSTPAPKTKTRSDFNPSTIANPYSSTKPPSDSNPPSQTEPSQTEPSETEESSTKIPIATTTQKYNITLLDYCVYDD